MKEGEVVEVKNCSKKMFKLFNYTDIAAVVVQQPLLEIKDRIVEDEKMFLLVRRFNAAGCFDDCGNEKRIHDATYLCLKRQNLH